MCNCTSEVHACACAGITGQDNGWVLGQEERRARRGGVGRLPACADATGDAHRADPGQGPDRDDVAARRHPLDRLPSRARDGEPHLARQSQAGLSLCDHRLVHPVSRSGVMTGRCGVAAGIETQAFAALDEPVRVMFWLRRNRRAQMQRRYITVDVFTDRAFGGNPLAVILDAGGLSTAQMQAIASEFNYSETTFVLPPQDPAHDAQVRIFTVRSELPFAGHPNVGTGFVLATQAAKPPARLVFEEKAGFVPVEILIEDGKVAGAELTAPQDLKKLKLAAEQAAACASLSAAD